MDTHSDAVERNQYLGLFVGEEEYAIGILRVKEILQCEAITRVPGTPPAIRGVINVRGSVVPVIDLAVKFRLPETVVTGRTCIVIIEVDLEGERTTMGVMADSVSQVFDLGPQEIVPPPAFGTRVHIDYLVGMGKWGKGFILILDIDKIMSATELVAAAGLGDETPAEAASETPATAGAVRGEA